MALSGSAATTPIGSLPAQLPGVAKGSRDRLPALPRENQVDMESSLRPLPFPLLSFSDHSIMGGFKGREVSSTTLTVSAACGWHRFRR